jgi:hypothetical protein
LQKEITSETKKAAEADRKVRQSAGKRGDRPNDTTRPKAKPVDKDGVGQ